MDARAALNRSVSTGLHLARGTADRLVRLAGPPLGKVTESVLGRVRGAGPPAAPATFTPSKHPATPTTPEPAGVRGPANDATPSPAKVARNIGPPRPTAAPPRTRRVPKSVPGAKLPPPRPSAS